MRLVDHIGIDDRLWRLRVNDHVAERVPCTVRHQSAHPELVAHARHIRSPPRTRTALSTRASSPATSSAAGHVRDSHDLSITPRCNRPCRMRSGRCRESGICDRGATPEPRRRSGTWISRMWGSNSSRSGEDHARRIPDRDARRTASSSRVMVPMGIEASPPSRSEGRRPSTARHAAAAGASPIGGGAAGHA